MGRRFFFVLAAVLASFTCLAQNPGELLNQWAAKSPIEKVYLHLDKDNYIAGETVWFKSYLFSDYQPDTISTSLYVEVVNDSGLVLSRSIVPILLGTASGQLELPVSMNKGVYILRAYTPTMLNQDAGFIYQKQLGVFGKNAVQTPLEKKIRLEFFPEGGNLVDGFSQTVAFKATNEYGLPIPIDGIVYNEKDEKIATLTTYHDGMGMFEITPSFSSKYYVITGGETKKHYLPGITAKGIGLTIIPHPQGHFFEIKQRNDDPAFKVAYMLGQMQHHIVFRQDFKTGNEQLTGVINTGKLHSGILQVTFFNQNNQPLAERLCFVNNKEYIQTGELTTDTISFLGKARNKISIRLKDTVRGSFSVSVTDGDFQQPGPREENIYSSLLLTSDLKGYIHKPAYYFSGDNDSVQTAMDLVMMTNGWRRFKWTELSKVPPSNIKDLSFITLSGKVTLRDSKKPFASKAMLLMLITADSTRRMQMISTDALGYFKLDSMMFFGRSKVFVSDIRGKKSDFIDVQIAADSLTRTFYLPAAMRPPYQHVVLHDQEVKLGIDFDAILKANGSMLQGVTVKAKRRNPIEELEEKYAKGAFSGDATRIIDLVNNKDAETYPNIFDYLQSRVPGLSIIEPDFESSPGATPPGYKLFYRQAANSSVSSMGPTPMVLYLNEVETEANVIQTISAAEVAMVKVFSTFTAATGGGAGGVLAIYTKKGSDLAEVMQHAADMVPYNGYSIVKEFYEPDYKTDYASRNRADNRVTLAWRPDVLISNVDPKIPVTFYNSDRAKTYRIVVEGMTLEGKMLLIEKWVENKK